jgi:hypothetical protein
MIPLTLQNRQDQDIQYKNCDRCLICVSLTLREELTKVYPKVSGLAAWSENCKWYSSLPLGAVIALLSESV